MGASTGVGGWKAGMWSGPLNSSTNITNLIFTSTFSERSYTFILPTCLQGTDMDQVTSPRPETGSYKLCLMEPWVSVDDFRVFCKHISLIIMLEKKFLILSKFYLHVSYLKKTILKFTWKFTLKQLRRVSLLQLHHHQGEHQFVLTKVTVVKIVH